MNESRVSEKSHSHFTWNALGNIQKGRNELGEEMPVLVYRLVQYTMLDILSKAVGEKQATDYFREAGYLAGLEFARNLLDLKAGFGAFIAQLQKKMKDLKIGILRMEDYHEDTGEIVLTVGEDLDCSGLPVTNESVCYYEEGFIAGILKAYTGQKYDVREIDCWASGDRVCRFRATVKE